MGSYEYRVKTESGEYVNFITADNKKFSIEGINVDNSTKTIKERLDILDGGVNGLTCETKQIEGWTVTSDNGNTGIKIAKVEIDVTFTELEWITSGSIFGQFISTKILNEQLPIGVFTAPPTVDVKWIYNQLAVMDIDIETTYKTLPSITDTGSFRPKFNNILNDNKKPLKLLMSITAWGR